MKNQNFDYESFAANAIKQVDEIRSLGGISPTVSLESRINAFYRLLGLPAIIRYNEIKAASNSESDKDRTETDPLNTGNNFKPDVVQATAEEINVFAHRVRGSIKKVTEAEAKAFANFNQAKLSHGTLKFENKSSRKRGLLFPMFVDGEAQIFPQERRVASPFSVDDGDAEVDGVRYRIPFIEVLIAIRLKGAGIYSEPVQKSIRELFPDIDTTDLSVIETNIIKALRLALNAIAEIAQKATADINKSSAKLSAPSFPPQGLNPDELVSFITGPGEGSTEKRKESITSAEAVNNALLTIMEYDNSFNTRAAKNIKESGLAGSLLSAISTEPEQEKKESERQEEKAKQSKRAGFRSLETLLGTFGGLSGVDIVVIMLAMMRLPLNDLIGLLNEESKLALERAKLNDPQKNDNSNERSITANATPVREAINNLQNRVKLIYNRLDSQVSIKKHRNKSQLKQQGDA